MPSCLVNGCHFGDGSKEGKLLKSQGRRYGLPTSELLREKWLNQIKR